MIDQAALVIEASAGARMSVDRGNHEPLAPSPPDVNARGDPHCATPRPTHSTAMSLPRTSRSFYCYMSKIGKPASDWTLFMATIRRGGT